MDPMNEYNALNEAKQMIAVADENQDQHLEPEEVLKYSEFFTGSKLVDYARSVHEERRGRNVWAGPLEEPPLRGKEHTSSVSLKTERLIKIDETWLEMSSREVEGRVPGLSRLGCQSLPGPSAAAKKMQIRCDETDTDSL
ncbi:hypothetical protein P7K49_015107 [Saguinus oedipus]|uniref:Uncharacterized protein n=1 Tax=Saguinus oedipus TaxID=9490 RepID=A0ABQ9VAA0_SAGOE|nr:hypothetical protein P7K49_015107 [Saguinus oedipus]